MKLNWNTKTSAILVALMQLTLSACAREGPLSVAAHVEILPDGSERDPIPSAEILKNLFTTSKKNLVFFPAGGFEMGDFGPKVDKAGRPYDSDEDSKPLHPVKLSRFAISKFPVTYAEFDFFSAAMRLPKINQNESVKSYRKPNNPAGVTWEGAKAYCNWIGKNLSEKYDLPTEAQWEYAARSGGKLHVYPTNNGKLESGKNVASFDQRKAAGGLVSVGSFPPNEAGIYAMGAGVLEYTNDWYDPDYYAHSPVDNPTGPTKGTNRVVRGYYGEEESAMTFKRWPVINRPYPRTWTRFPSTKSEAKRIIPNAKYSDLTDKTFRCVVN